MIETYTFSFPFLSNDALMYVTILIVWFFQWLLHFRHKDHKNTISKIHLQVFEEEYEPKKLIKRKKEIQGNTNE